MAGKESGLKGYEVTSVMLDEAAHISDHAYDALRYWITVPSDTGYTYNIYSSATKQLDRWMQIYLKRRDSANLGISMDFQFKVQPKTFAGYTLFATKAVAWPDTHVIVRCDKCGARVTDAKVSDIAQMKDSFTWIPVFEGLRQHCELHTKRHTEAEERY